jgi:ERCC4-related helicase
MLIYFLMLQVSAAKGLTQAEQAHVLQQFNDGAFNVLVATCIAEEGKAHYPEHT